jgi:DNA primase
MQSVWDQIKDKLDIVDVISDYISLKASGSNYKGSSPFKKEKTPSLMVSQTKQIWHDFSTGQGGDIFGFVMLIENITRGEALKLLAKKANIELKPQRPKSPEESIQEEITQNRSIKGIDYLEWSCKLYHAILLKILENSNHPITEYCKSRGLDYDTIAKFRLGYAPSNNQVLHYAQRNNIDINLLVDIGILKQTESGTIKDNFVNRLMIPIINSVGNVVGYTGRVLPGDTLERPKYLNTKQTEWFDKSSIWFGLYYARKHIVQAKQALVLEGNMDVITSHRKGLDIAIASQGTSFTTQQLQILKRLTSTIILGFDTDNAGILASSKLYMEAKQIGFEVMNISIPDEHKDIDEYLCGQTTTANLSDLTPKPFIIHWLNTHKHQLSSTDPSIQKQIILDTLKLISFSDPIEVSQYTKQLSIITSITQNVLIETIAFQFKNYKSIQKPTELTINNRDLDAPILSAAKQYFGNAEHNVETEALYRLYKDILHLEPESLSEYKLFIKDEIELMNENHSIDIESTHKYMLSILDAKFATLGTSTKLHSDYELVRGIGAVTTDSISPSET